MSSDPHGLTTTQHGTRLRDAAVNPADTDFLPPVNAGLEGEDGNPHGPNVVAPGIHAGDGPRPVRPGPVSSDPATQSTEESEHAEAHVLGEPEEPETE